MTKQQAENRARLYARLEKYGIDANTADILRRIEMTLSRWSEMECGESNAYAVFAVERDEKTGKPYRCVYPHHEGAKNTRTPIPDREKGALVRLKRVMAGHPALWYYHQTDPRGCALYIGRRADLTDGAALDSVYMRGVAVC